MAIAFVKNGGTNSSKSGSVTSLAATVPTGGHAAGDLVLVVWTSNGGGSGNSFSCADSRSNSYVQVGGGANGNSALQVWVFASVLATALLANDTITVSGTTVSQAATTTAEYSGVGATDDIATVLNNGSSRTPTASGTPVSAATLVIGGLGVNGPTGDSFTEATGWNSLASAGTSGGPATSNIVVHAAYQILTSASAQNYNPSLGTSRLWAESLTVLDPISATSPVPLPPHITSQAINRATIF